MTSNGKRSALYAGSRQVFVAPLDRIDTGSRIILDVRGVCGYATKAHFVPPVPTRMMEGVSEWLVVQDAIVNDPRSILISGMRVRKAYGGSRPTLKMFRALMIKIRSRMTQQERWEDELVDTTDQEIIPIKHLDLDDQIFYEEVMPKDLYESLNSDLVSVWSQRVKVALKNFKELFQTVSWSIMKSVDYLRRRYLNIIKAVIPPPE